MRSRHGFLIFAALGLLLAMTEPALAGKRLERIRGGASKQIRKLKSKFQNRRATGGKETSAGKQERLLRTRSPAATRPAAATSSVPGQARHDSTPRMSLLQGGRRVAVGTLADQAILSVAGYTLRGTAERRFGNTIGQGSERGILVRIDASSVPEGVQVSVGAVREAMRASLASHGLDFAIAILPDGRRASVDRAD